MEYSNPLYNEIVEYLVSTKKFPKDKIEELIKMNEITLRYDKVPNWKRKDPWFCLNLKTLDLDIQTRILRRISWNKDLPKDQHLWASKWSYIIFTNEFDLTKPFLITEWVTDTIRWWCLYNDSHNIIWVPWVDNTFDLVQSLHEKFLKDNIVVKLIIDNDPPFTWANLSIIKIHNWVKEQWEIVTAHMQILDVREALQWVKDLDDAYCILKENLVLWQWTEVLNKETAMKAELYSIKNDFWKNAFDWIVWLKKQPTYYTLCTIRSMIKDQSEVIIEDRYHTAKNFHILPTKVTKKYEYDDILNKDVYIWMDVYSKLVYWKEINTDFINSTYRKTQHSIKKASNNLSKLFFKPIDKVITEWMIIRKVNELAHFLLEQGLIEEVKLRTNLWRSSDWKQFISSDEVIDTKTWKITEEESVVHESKLEIWFSKNSKLEEEQVTSIQWWLWLLSQYLFNDTDINNIYLWFIWASIFQPEIRKKIRWFPILFLQWVTNSGKSYSAEVTSRIIWARYWMRKPVSDLTSTPYVLAQHFNANRHVLYVDEVNDWCYKDTIDLIKSSYDWYQVEKWKSYNKWTGIESWATRVALIVASESLPANNSLFNRWVIVYLDQSMRNNKAFLNRTLWEEQLVEKFSAYYYELLRRKKEIDFHKFFDEASKVIDTYLDRNDIQLEVRMIKNLKVFAFWLHITSSLDPNNLKWLKIVIDNYKRNLNENATSHNIIEHIVNNPDLYCNRFMENSEKWYGNPKVFINHEWLRVVPKQIGTIFCRSTHHKSSIRKVINEFCTAIWCDRKMKRRNVYVSEEKRVKMHFIPSDILEQNEYAREIFLSIYNSSKGSIWENDKVSNNLLDQLNLKLQTLEDWDKKK